jgi:NAD+ kinase
MIDVKTHCRGNEDCFRVLNDVVVSRSALARINQIQVLVDGGMAMNMLADGLIVSTPTGSTAYSMAAGGPICHPAVDAIILTPICPHLLANRPVLVPGTSKLRIELVDGGESYITMDGQVGNEFQVGDWIELHRSETLLKVFRNPKRTYYQTLRDKLRWGKR